MHNVSLDSFLVTESKKATKKIPETHKHAKNKETNEREAKGKRRKNFATK